MKSDFLKINMIIYSKNSYDCWINIHLLCYTLRIPSNMPFDVNEFIYGLK